MKISWQIRLALELIFLSGLLYILNYLVFHDIIKIESSFLTSLAYTPIQVLFVTLFVNELLRAREKRNKIHSLHIIIGVFFTEVGIDYLKRFVAMDPLKNQFQKDFDIKLTWKKQDFDELEKRIKKDQFSIEIDTEILKDLQIYMKEKWDEFLTILENPNLFEHEAFTEMLWTVFHLGEEIFSRKDLTKLHSTDYHHLEKDLGRTYNAMVLEYIKYLRHISLEFPYLYSFAVRTNPFADLESVEVLSEEFNSNFE